MKYEIEHNQRNVIELESESSDCDSCSSKQKDGKEGVHIKVESLENTQEKPSTRPSVWNFVSKNII